MEFKPMFTVVDSSTTADMAEEVKLDLSFFTSGDAKVPATVDASETKKKRSSAKPKVAINGEIVTDAPLANPIPGASIMETNYAQSYAETNNLIRGTIMQVDQLSAEIKEDIDTVRSSKTMKGKYTYLTTLTSSASALIGTRLQAIRELNSTITQCHNLEMNRAKMIKANEKDENDDMKMMDIYSAFVNAPLGTYNPMGNPNIQDLTLGVNNPNGNVSGVEMVVPRQAQALTAEQNRMRMESNPNIQTVVRYDQTTGQRMFDVIDKMSGASIPNYPRPDNFLLDDTTIDVHAGIARNRNINMVWPLMLEGSNTFIAEY